MGFVEFQLTEDAIAAIQVIQALESVNITPLEVKFANTQKEKKPRYSPHGIHARS